MYKSHLKARRGASQGGTPLAEIDSTSVESAWSVTPSQRQFGAQQQAHTILVRPQFPTEILIVSR